MPVTGQWYVITVRKNVNSPFTVQVSQMPFPQGALKDSGPYATRALAQTAADKLKAMPVPGAPGLTNPLGGIDAVGHFFANLTDRNTVIRIVEVLIGIVLITGASLKLAENTQAGKAVKAAIPKAVKATLL
jgi:hypothetical protein